MRRTDVLGLMMLLAFGLCSGHGVPESPTMPDSGEQVNYDPEATSNVGNTGSHSITKVKQY